MAHLTKEDLKSKAKEAREYAYENRETIKKILKRSLYLGLGYFLGMKFQNMSDTKDLKKMIPVFCYNTGAEGMDAYKMWIMDNVPEAMKAIDDFIAKNPDKQWVDPYFMRHPDVIKQFMLCGADPDKFLEEMSKNR